jgi:hypothetical protein
MSDKLHRFLFDGKTGSRYIETVNPVCRGCYKDFVDGDVAYLSDRTFSLFCEDCLKTPGMVSEFYDTNNDNYLYGVIKVKPIRRVVGDEVCWLWS